MSKGEDITTRYKLDISDLKKGISEANKNIKLANAEFKAASAGMDDWAKSSDGITAKLKQLNSVLNEEKTKLENYKKQQQELDKAYSENGKRADELKVKLAQLASQGVSKTSEECRKYQKALTDVEKEQQANKKASDDLRITILNQQGTVNKTEKEIKNYQTALKEMQSEEKKTATATDELTKDIEKQQNELDELKSKYKDVVLEQGKDSEEAKKLASRIDELSGKLSENKKQLNDAETATNELDKSLTNVEDTSKDTSEGFTVMKGALASLVADGIRKAIDGFKECVKEAITITNEIDKATNTFISQTGESTESAEKFRNIMLDIYNDNFGENFEDIAKSMATVKQNLKELDGDELKKATENALLLRDTFEFDINESTRTASMLVKQFGINSEEAFALMAQGAQLGLDKNGDLLDTLNEYAVHYKQLGYSVDDMMNMLVNGTKSGTFSVDKLGDAIKEFGIRSKDTANTTTEGFQLIGLNADKMRKKFAQGGEVAKEATNETLKALFNLDDQVKRNQAGVDLFGTMWEDLGIDGVKALMDLNGEVKVSTNMLKKINDTKYDDIGSAIQAIKRNLVTSISEPIQKKVLPALNNLIKNVDWDAFAKKVSTAITGVINVFKWFVEHKDIVIGAISGMITAFAVVKIVNFATAIGKVVKGLTSAPTIITGVTNAMKALNLTALANPYVLLAAAITGITVALGVWAYKSDEVTQKLINERKEAENETKIVDENKKAWDELNESKQNSINAGMSEMQHYQELYDELTNIVDANGKVKEGYEGRASFITGTLSEALGIEIKTVDGVIQKYGELKESFDKVMEKKKAMIVLEAQETAYKEAITKKADLLRAQNELEQELADKKIEREKLLDSISESKSIGETLRLQNQLSNVQKAIEEKAKQYDTQEEMLNEYAYNIGQYETNMALMHEEKYDEISNVSWEMVKTAQETGDQQKALLEQQIEDESSELKRLRDLKEKHNTDIYDNQIKASEERLKQLQGEMKDYVATVEGGNENATTEWREGVANQLSEATGKKVEFKDAGDGMVQMYVDGVEEGTPKAESAMKTMAEDSIKKINEQQPEADNAGQNFLTGILNGISNMSLQNKIFSEIYRIGSSMIAKMKGSLDEHSPSKATKLMGQYFMQGLGIGIEDEEDSIFKQIKNVGEKMRDTLENQLQDEIGIPISVENAKSSLSQLKNNLANSLPRNNSVSNSITNSNNFTQIINAPKQLSRIEIYRQTKNLLEYKGG